MKKKRTLLICFFFLLFGSAIFSYVQITTNNYNRISLKKASIEFCYNNITENTVKSHLFVDVELVKIDSSRRIEGTSIDVIVLNNKNAPDFEIGAFSRFVNEVNYKLLRLNGNRAVMAEVTIAQVDPNISNSKMCVYINPFTGRVFAFSYTH